jgi:predicted RNA-binding Zn-ribbon protein involved in translation (DUF1610 family)
MNIDRKVVEQALEDLKGIHPGNMTPMAEEYWNKAITVLRQAFEQPVVTSDTSQERVYENGKQRHDFECPRCGHCCQQREWVGLTDEQLHKIIRSGEYDSMEEFARAIEAKLKEKNHG